jgi:hypothetical protein
LKSWDASTTFSQPAGVDTSASGRVDLTAQIPTLIEYFSLSILDPTSLHDDIHPAPISSTPAAAPTNKGAKSGKARIPPAFVAPTTLAGPSEEEELAEERWARYRVGGLTGLSWLIGQIKATQTAPSAELAKLLTTSLLWTSLSSMPPSEDVQILGHQQAPVRRAGYILLATILEAYPSLIEEKSMLEMLSLAVLGKCWTEKEGTVWEAAGPAVVKFLSSRFILTGEIHTDESRIPSRMAERAGFTG